MNTDQAINLVTKVIIITASGLATKYGFSATLDGWATLGATLLVSIGAWYWSHHRLSTAPVNTLPGGLVPPSNPDAPIQQGLGAAKSASGPQPLLALVVLTALAISLLGSGCMSGNQTLNKSTVFGMNIHTPGPSGSQIAVQFGLVRNEYFTNPTSTNAVYAGPWSSAVYGNLGLWNQSAYEYEATSANLLPAAAYLQPSISNAYPYAGITNIAALSTTSTK